MSTLLSNFVPICWHLDIHVRVERIFLFAAYYWYRALKSKMLAFNFVTKNVLFQLRHENIVIPTSSRFSATVLESFVIVPCACFVLEESKRLELTQLFLQLVVRE